MHYDQNCYRSRPTLVTLGLLALGLTPGVGRADEPGIFGRIFRGGNSQASANKPGPASANTPGLTYGRSGSPSNAPGSKFDAVPAPSYTGGAISDPVSTPQPEISGDAGAMPKLTPKSRVNRPITNAEPILTRFALGRSNDGSQFAMFLEIFADGTVLDSEGVHHVRQADLQPVLEAIQSSDFSKVRGHSGAPPTDFIDHVQIIVFDRRLGRLTAHPFSYSGNPQGTDHAIRHLHTALEGLQLKLSKPGQPSMGATPPGASAMQLTVPAPNGFSTTPANPLTPTNTSGNAGQPNSFPLTSPPLPNPSVGQPVPSAAASSPLSPRVSAR